MPPYGWATIITGRLRLGKLSMRILVKAKMEHRAMLITATMIVIGRLIARSVRDITATSLLALDEGTERCLRLLLPPPTMLAILRAARLRNRPAPASRFARQPRHRLRWQARTDISSWRFLLLRPPP